MLLFVFFFFGVNWLISWPAGWPAVVLELAVDGCHENMITGRNWKENRVKM